MAERELILVTPGGDRLPPHEPHHNEGRTVAGWVTALGLMVGATVVGAGMIAHLTALTWVGVALIVLTLVAGALLRVAGLGQPSRPARTAPTTSSGVRTSA